MSLFNKNSNPFEANTGSMKLTNFTNLIFVFASLLLTTLIIVKAEIVGFVLILALFAVTGIVYSIFQKPKLGIYLLIVMGFFVTGMARYVPAPWGLAIDGLLVLIYLALFFKGFNSTI